MLDKNFPTLDCSICIEAPKMSEVDLHPNIEILEIAIKDREESDFSIISTSKMLSVPYAFHAATASELLDFGTGNLSRIHSGQNP